MRQLLKPNMMMMTMMWSSVKYIVICYLVNRRRIIYLDKYLHKYYTKNLFKYYLIFQIKYLTQVVLWAIFLSV